MFVVKLFQCFIVKIPNPSKIFLKIEKDFCLGKKILYYPLFLLLQNYYD